MSPSDSLKELGKKIGEFLENGVLLVWLVDPARETVTVYRSLTQTKELEGSDVITAEPVVPGFAVEVRRFF